MQSLKFKKELKIAKNQGYFEAKEKKKKNKIRPEVATAQQRA